MRDGGILVRLLGKIRYGVVIGLLIGTAVGWFSYRGWRQASSWEQAVTIPVADFEPGTVRLAEGLWVARQHNGEFFVFLNKDPHGGHPFEWVESEAVFRSPKLCCANGPHDEVYWIDGTCKANNCNTRPPGSLYRVDSKAEGDYLLAVPGRIVSGGIPTVPWWRQMQMEYEKWRNVRERR